MSLFNLFSPQKQDSVEIQIDSEVKALLDDVVKNSGAKNYTEALRYAILHAKFTWNEAQGKDSDTVKTVKKRETSEHRIARLRETLEKMIADNQCLGNPILMRVTGSERTTLGVSEIPVKHWQLAITERAIRDETGVNQSIAAGFIIDYQSQIDQHNKWLFDNCGWTPKDAHAFNRRTKAASRKFSQLGLSDNE